MQLGPGTVSLAYAMLIVSFAPFSAIKTMEIIKELVEIGPNEVCDKKNSISNDNLISCDLTIPISTLTLYHPQPVVTATTSQ